MLLGTRQLRKCIDFNKLGDLELLWLVREDLLHTCPFKVWEHTAYTDEVNLAQLVGLLIQIM